ncbi:MAG: hypothetical protein NXH75_09000 [Halobacteriovoraceae bacterium]|nr:hypothetical protein [Halobacteriovoraceae bacterium]
MKILSLILILMVFFSSCGQDSNDEKVITINQGQSDEILHILFQSMSSFEAQVFFEPGAEPYTGNTLSGKPIWNFFEKNVSNALKATSRGLSLTIPKSLTSMTNIGSKNKTTWTANELVQLASGHGQENTAQKGVLKLFFLNGSFADESGSKPSVLGVHITNSMVVVIFKDNIDAIRSSQGLAVARFSEQSVLIHEFGHALGLVNNGVSPQTAHHDSEHGGHCTNSNCVMYWQNEGSDDLVQFIRNYIATGDEDLFGNQCLQDLHSLIP